MRNKPHRKIDPATLIKGLKSPQMTYALFANGHMIENNCGSLASAIRLAQNTNGDNIHVRRYDRTGYSSYEEIVYSM